MAKYRVIGAVAVVRGQNKSERYLYRDAVFEDDGLDAANLQHLQGVGLIEELPAESDAGDNTSVELPAESWNNERIDEWAAKQDPPIVFVNPDDATKAPTKKHRLAQIAVELDARKAQQ